MKSIYGLNEYGSGYLQLINLSLGKLPETIELEGEELIIKNEFHISLVWVGKLSEMVDKQNKEKIKKEMIEDFERFTEKYSLKDYELTKELRLVRKGSQKTIIVMAKVPHLKTFFDQLSLKYGLELPYQPTHITLYTLPTDKIGIGILSEEELNDFSEPIDISAIQRILSKT